MRVGKGGKDVSGTFKGDVLSVLKKKKKGSVFILIV